MLSTWLHPDDRFVAEILGRSHHFFPPTEERARSVAALSPSWRVADLLQSARGDAVAWFQTRDGKHETARLSLAAARPLYEAGITIYLQDLPCLDPIFGDAATTLRMPAANIQCALFCNKPDAVSRMHFDSVDTIAVQVTGSKEWRIAPNTHAPRPTHHWKTLTEVPEELRRYAHEPFPSEMPSDATTHRLEPGAMLYVPRGYWHETVSSEESVSLHLHLLPYMWLDALIATLQARLARDVDMRAQAYPLCDPGRADWSVAEALARLRAVVDGLAPDDLVFREDRPIVASDPLVRRPRTSLSVEAHPDDASMRTVTLGAEGQGDARVTTIDMAHEHAQATLALARASAPLSATELHQRFALPIDDAVELVNLLRHAGFVRRA